MTSHLLLVKNRSVIIIAYYGNSKHFSIRTISRIEFFWLENFHLNFSTRTRMKIFNIEKSENVSTKKTMLFFIFCSLIQEEKNYY